MASGRKEMTVNSLERAVSTDINRLQKFSNAAHAEFFRALMNTSLSSDDAQSGGQDNLNTSLGTPVSAELAGGSLLVRPQVGSFNVLVDGGSGYFLAPDAAADDSPYKFVLDAGVPAPGTLTMATNASGSIRIDVIECNWTVNNTVETDNRDIFNPATGSFAPATVTKAVAGQLQYRIRQGTAGGGFPGVQQGWLPLAVASVPGGSPTSNDAITFWDVRPLVADRAFPPFNKGSFYGKASDIDVVSDLSLGGGIIFLGGKCDVVPADFVNGIPGLRRLGGTINRGTPGTDLLAGSFTGVNLNDAANQSASFTGGGLNYIYLLEPLGLPRWARYTDASTGSRVPRSPRGMIVVTNISPQSSPFLTPAPSAPIPVPVSTGLATSATMGACIGALNYGGTVSGAFLTRGGVSTNQAFGQGLSFAPSSQGATSVAWNLSPGTTHPGNAKFVNVTLQLAAQIAANTTIQVTILTTVQDNAGNNLGIHPNVNEVYTLVNQGAAAGIQFAVKVRVPVDFLYSSMKLLVGGTFSSGSFVAGGGTQLMYVTGWET